MSVCYRCEKTGHFARCGLSIYSNGESSPFPELTRLIILRWSTPFQTGSAQRLATPDQSATGILYVAQSAKMSGKPSSQNTIKTFSSARKGNKKDRWFIHLFSHTCLDTPMFTPQVQQDRPLCSRMSWGRGWWERGVHSWWYDDDIAGSDDDDDFFWSCLKLKLNHQGF